MLYEKNHFIVFDNNTVCTFTVCLQINTYDDPGNIYKVRLGFADDFDQKLLLNEVRIFAFIIFVFLYYCLTVYRFIFFLYFV